MKQNVVFIIIATLFLCCMLEPACAVMQEVTVKGLVATVNQPKNTLTVGHPQQYGCNYPESGMPFCTYTPMSVEVLTGTVPDASAFSIFKTGDTIVATSIGGSGGTWITLAKLFGSRPNEEFVTEIIGEIGTVPTPLIGNYALEATTVPDCQRCAGTICAATSANVTVMSEADELLVKTIRPGESFTFNGRNDGSSIDVTFVKGEALSVTCPNKGGMAGPQAISVYVVRIMPPISAAQTNIRTATTTRPDEALTPLTMAPPVVTTTTAVPVTTKAGTLPLVAIGAIGLAGLVLVMRR